MGVMSKDQAAASAMYWRMSPEDHQLSCLLGYILDDQVIYMHGSVSNT